MRKKNLRPLTKAFRVLIVMTGLLILACSQSVVFPTSEVVPAAKADLTVVQDDSQNYNIHLRVEDLAVPERLSPPRRNYVVWVVTRKNGTINIGNLSVNRRNKGSLKTMIPYEPIRAFITAEDEIEVVLPSTQVILDSGEFDL